MIAVVACVLMLPLRADAHRLDEYLQATRISVDADRVDLELDLSPGVSVADAIIADIDVDRDGLISDGEARAYAQSVLAALTVTVDGQRVVLRPDGERFPTPGEMRDGLGTIRLAASASMPLTSGRRTLAFTNAYRRDVGAYLVNALVPSDRRVTLIDQRRDPLQRTFTLDFDVAGSRAWIGWSGLFVAMLALLALRRHLHARHIEALRARVV